MVGHSAGPGRASKGPQDPQPWAFSASPSFIRSFMHSCNTEVLETYSASDHSEHLTCTILPNLDSSQG